MTRRGIQPIAAKDASSGSLRIVEADLNRDEHGRAVLDLIDAYAMDPMANGKPLPEDVRRDLVPGLRRHPTTIVFLAYLDDEAVGVAVCFFGFSTFAARQLINIHDLAVLPAYRGRGIGKRLLEAVENKARAMGCCKLTLEVLEYNVKARRVYHAAGFTQSAYQTDAGGALFYSKTLA